MSTKDRIIDAVEAVLTEAGPGGTTLEVVAARAGVSKGGLLYHFGSKEALYTGLLDRLKELGAQDATPTDGQSLIAAYLATSSVAQGSFTSTLMAALRLVGEPGLEVEGAVLEAIDHWETVLAEEITDPTMRRLVMLVGDGLYLRALLGAPSGPGDGRLSDLVERVTQERSTS